MQEDHGTLADWASLVVCNDVEWKAHAHACTDSLDDGRTMTKARCQLDVPRCMQPLE